MVDDNDELSTPRRRAKHTNSHTGCLTCKQRKLKCDERKPICLRCERARKDCKPDVRVKKKTWLGTQATLSTIPLSLEYGTEAYTQSCLQYFCDVTLPAFDRCEPSPLWDYMQQELHSDSIRCMAIALGHEHRSATQATDTPPEASLFYIQAVQSLRQVIAEVGTESTFTIVFHCLLLVILQCFRKRFDELNIHLQHGLRIASQERALSTATTALSNTVTTTTPLRESVRLLKQYSIAVALFNPLLPQDGLYAGITTTTSNKALSEPDDLKTAPTLSGLLTDDQILRDEEQNLLLELIGTTVTHRRPRMNGDDGGLEFVEPLEADTALVLRVNELRARHATLEHAIKQLASSKNMAKDQYYEVAEARCSLVGIYLRCRWSGYATNYDLEHETFARIVSKIEASLEHTSMSTFSIGLGVVAPLFYTAIMCRQAKIRRRAVELLSKCPQQDGPWNAMLAKDICTIIIRDEEQKARKEGAGYALTGYIPEHCRVGYYYYSYSTEDIPRREYLRVFRRQGGSDVYSHEDLSLSQCDLSQCDLSQYDPV